MLIGNRVKNFEKYDNRSYRIILNIAIEIVFSIKIQMKELFSLYLLILLLATGLSAIIITQSIPSIVQISPTKYIIAIDQPKDTSDKVPLQKSIKVDSSSKIHPQETTVVQTSKTTTQKVDESALINQIAGIAQLYDTRSVKTDPKSSGAVNIILAPAPSTPSSTQSTNTPSTTQTPVIGLAESKKVASSIPMIGLANPKNL